MDELTEEVYFEEINRIEKIYYTQYHLGNVTSQIQFDYAWCLVRSRYPADIKKGVMLLEELCVRNTEGQREYLYFLAVGNAKLKEFGRALKCIRCCLNIEPDNRQMLRLQTLIKRRMREERMALKALFTLALAGVATFGYMSYKYLKRFYFFK